MTKEEKEKLMENDVENLIRWRIWKERTSLLLGVGGFSFVCGIVAIIVAPAIQSDHVLGGFAGILGGAGILLIILGALLLSPGVIIKIIAEPRYNAYEQIVFGSKERKEAATESLINYVQNDKKGEAAIDILGEIGNRRAVDPLIQALKDENGYKNDYVRWKVRKSAAEALGKIGDARAVEPLIQALKDKDVVVRKNAPEALKDVVVRNNAASALGQIGDVRAVDPLIQALNDENTVVRAYAARALGWIGDVRAVDPLIQALKSTDVTVRLWASEALGKIGDAKAVEPLIQALKDEDEDVRAVAKGALEKIKAKKS